MYEKDRFYGLYLYLPNNNGLHFLDSSYFHSICFW